MPTRDLERLDKAIWQFLISFQEGIMPEITAIKDVFLAVFAVPP
jgi:hypothetical protein